MPFQVEHELHHRRRGRNLGLFVVLVAFVGLIFVLTIVKVTVEGNVAPPTAAAVQP
jgi:1-acyl-sn-glycerol-3-phosphate acyltransferase